MAGCFISDAVCTCHQKYYMLRMELANFIDYILSLIFGT